MNSGEKKKQQNALIRWERDLTNNDEEFPKTFQKTILRNILKKML